MRHTSLALTLALAASMTSGALAATRGPAAHNPPEYRAAGNIIGRLSTIATIGSTIDPLNGDSNPYGLTIAPASGGAVVAGDLVVCNFNDSFNIQGLGTSIELLAPVVGSKPQHLIADPRLTGCAAIALGGAAPWVAALDANDNPIVSGAGVLVDPINNFAWTGPWGQAFVAGPKSPPAFYESNANDGSIVRINLGATFTFDTIALSLPVNHGVPGSILAPSGLTYDPKLDVLYVVDGAINALIGISNPATIPAGGISFAGGTIHGPYASRVKIVYAGSPLRGPISSTLLYSGDIVVSNSANNALVEITPSGKLVAVHSVDAGPAGALFGIVATGTSAATTKVYFNDDNDNTVKVLF